MKEAITQKGTSLAIVKAIPPGNNPKVQAYAYLDTIEVYFPLTLSPHLPALRRQGWWIELSTDPKGRLWGYRLILNQPFSRNRLLELDELANEFRGVLSRLDVAFDLQPPLSSGPNEIMDRIARTALLKYRRKGPMHKKEGTLYWVRWGKGERRFGKNLVLYPDHNRMTGELNAVHLELRFLRPDMVKRQMERQGLHGIKGLIDIDPHELLEHRVKWSEEAADKHIRTVVKREGNLPPRKVKEILRRIGHDKAQGIKDVFPRRRFKPSLAPFEAPRKLIWSGCNQ
jgi:hypothetical protein